MVLKKIQVALFIVLSFLFVAKINAQSWRFGIHATPTFNYISSSQPDAENNLELKFGFGLLAEYKFADNYAIASGIDIISKGGDVTVMDTTGSYSAGFIEIPLGLKMSSRQFGYFTYFARFGGVVGIETSEEVNFDPEMTVDKELESYINPLNVGFRFGGGAEYSLGGSTALVAEITYNRSLIDNLNQSDSRFRKKYTYRFDYIALSIGVIF